MAEALDFAGRYLAGTTTGWAYPACDAYPGSGLRTVDQQALLAVALLNAHQKPLLTYYGLTRLLPELNVRLAALGDAEDISSVGIETLSRIASLYGVIDDFPQPEVQLTKLSKVLHLKRPGLLPLSDVNIRRCYGESRSGPVRSVYTHSWEGYCLEWLSALQHDLVSQMESWCEIAALATSPAIPPLRALAIIGWELGREGRQRQS